MNRVRVFMCSKTALEKEIKAPERGQGSAFSVDIII